MINSLSNGLRRAKLLLKIVLSLYEFTYFKLFFMKKKELIVNDETDLVIDGFPRSGNTFAAVAVGRTKKRINISHHTHSPANIKRAVKKNIPTIVLIRKPDDAIKSLMIMYPFIKVGLASFWYCLFYSSLIAYKNEVLIINFEILTKKFILFLEKYNQKFGFLFKIRDIDDKEKETIFKYIEGLKNNGVIGVAVPTEEKKIRKDNLFISVDSFWYKRALRIYNRFME